MFRSFVTAICPRGLVRRRARRFARTLALYCLAAAVYVTSEFFKVLFFESPVFVASPCLPQGF